MLLSPSGGLECKLESGMDFMVGTIPVGPSAAASPLGPEKPIVLDPSLTPEIMSTQLDHLLNLQQRLEAGWKAVGQRQEFQDLDLEVAQLIDTMCKQHISSLGASWNIR